MENIMEQKKRIIDEHVGMVSEPAPHVGVSVPLQEMRHSLVDAIYSSCDVEKLYSCLVILNQLPKNEYRSKYRTKTDAELSAELSQFPSWDELKHADLSDVDYRHYKHKKSPKTIKTISKWL